MQSLHITQTSLCMHLQYYSPKNQSFFLSTKYVLHVGVALTILCTAKTARSLNIVTLIARIVTGMKDINAFVGLDRQS